MGYGMNNEINRLREMEFWSDVHNKNKDCCFNHAIGLPKHPATGEPCHLTPYQVEFFEIVVNEITKPATSVDTKQKGHRFVVINGRQMGFTELVLRIIYYFSLNRYVGKNVVIIPATNKRLGKAILGRLKEFGGISKLTASQSQTHLKLKNGTVIRVFAATENALEDLDDVACIFMDAAARGPSRANRALANVILPMIRENDADLFLVSQPKGYNNKISDIMDDHTGYVYAEYDIRHTVGNMYTREHVDDMLNDNIVNVNQEYLCKRTR